MKEELKNIKHAITLLQKAVAQLEGRLPVETTKKQNGFRPPHKQDAGRYHAQKGYSFDLDEWFNYYIANGWRVGRNPMKSWEAAMAQWESRHKKENPERTRHKLDAHGRPIVPGNGRLL